MAMMKCSTKIAPWFAIPANCKWFRNLAVSQIILEELESMKIKLPAPSVDLQETRRLAAIELSRLRQERKMRKTLENAKKQQRDNHS